MSLEEQIEEIESGALEEIVAQTPHIEDSTTHYETLLKEIDKQYKSYFKQTKKLLKRVKKECARARKKQTKSLNKKIKLAQKYGSHERVVEYRQQLSDLNENNTTVLANRFNAEFEYQINLESLDIAKVKPRKLMKYHYDAILEIVGVVDQSEKKLLTKYFEQKNLTPQINAHVSGTWWTPFSDSEGPKIPDAGWIGGGVAGATIGGLVFGAVGGFVGVGVGLVGGWALSIPIAYKWYTRKSKNEKEFREYTINELVHNANTKNKL